MINDTRAERRTVLRAAAAALAAGTAGLAAGTMPVRAAGSIGTGRLPAGDVAILRFLAAAELIETDMWVQYAELGGTQDHQLPGLPTGGSAAYINALQQLDSDMPQYIHDNTDDEVSHNRFINAFLVAHGEAPVEFDEFRTLPSSQATGARQIGRLTNLMQVTVDTSFYTRYRSSRHNPDLEPGFRFPQAVPSLNVGRWPAIPRTDADLAPQGHIQAIANTAAFHFCEIEVGGTSLYPSLVPGVQHPDVLKILLSIGPTEAMHFQTWHDKAGNAVQPPLAPLTDPSNPGLSFPNLNTSAFNAETFQTNLIMPEPVVFLDPSLPPCSIIRPTSLSGGGAVAATNSFVAQGVFIGQPAAFLNLVFDLAHQADAAVHQRGKA